MPMWTSHMWTFHILLLILYAFSNATRFELVLSYYGKCKNSIRRLDCVRVSGLCLQSPSWLNTKEKNYNEKRFLCPRRHLSRKTKGACGVTTGSKEKRIKTKKPNKHSKMNALRGKVGGPTQDDPGCARTVDRNSQKAIFTTGSSIPNARTHGDTHISGWQTSTPTWRNYKCLLLASGPPWAWDKNRRFTTVCDLLPLF